jgi:hypothetical protein
MFSDEKTSLLPLPVEPLRYYQHVNTLFTWMVAWKSRRLTTARHRALSEEGYRCNGIATFVCSIPRPANCCASTCVNHAAHCIISRRPPRKNSVTTQQLLRRAENVSDRIGVLYNDVSMGTVRLDL